MLARQQVLAGERGAENVCSQHLPCPLAADTAHTAPEATSEDASRCGSQVDLDAHIDTHGESGSEEGSDRHLSHATLDALGARRAETGLDATVPAACALQPACLGQDASAVGGKRESPCAQQRQQPPADVTGAAQRAARARRPARRTGRLRGGKQLKLGYVARKRPTRRARCASPGSAASCAPAADGSAQVAREAGREVFGGAAAGAFLARCSPVEAAAWILAATLQQSGRLQTPGGVADGDLELRSSVVAGGNDA